MNKKGSVQDLIMIMVILVVFGSILLVGFKMTSMFNTQIQSMVSIPNESKAISTQMVGYFPGVLDNTFLFLTIGLCLVAIVLAALVRVHPIFIVFYILALIIIIIMSAVFSNVYQTMAGDPVFAAEAAQLTFIGYILAALPFLVGIIGIIIMAIMFKLGDTI